MLVRCPQCRTEFRLTDYGTGERVVKYLCPGCNEIVRVDLALDEVRSSSSSGSFRQMERPRTVLVADDADAVLRLASDLLADAGFRVLVASDGAEALRRIRDDHPDVVVLDLLMPGLTGFDVLREMRQDERLHDIAVLAMSSVYKDNVLAFLHEIGARGFLDKRQLREALVFRVRGLVPPAAAR